MAYLRHPLMRDVYMLVHTLDLKGGKVILQVSWFQRRSGYFLGNDILRIPYRKYQEFREVSLEEVFND
jgi:hypothetical protein